MEIRVLRYFLAVAQEGNITRAAESLHIAQPSLSKQLMELEQELGTQLLIRGKRHITLTEEGVLLRKRAEEILCAPEQALPPEPAQPAWQPETRLEQMAAELMGWFDAMMPQE